MLRRPVVVLGLVVGVAALVTSGVMRRWQGVPLVTPPPAVTTPAVVSEPAPAPEPAKPRVSSVELKRGDNLVRALVREGVDQRVGNDIATALRQRGVNLKKLRPQH